MNNRTLLIIFLALAAFFGVRELFFKKAPQSFKTELIQIDSTAVDRIVINPKEGEPFTLTKTDGNWVASQGELNVDALPNAVQSILGSLTLIKTRRIAAKSSDKWAEYEVDEGNGITIEAYEGSKKLEEFIVGRFSFNQQTRSGTSYVRLSSGDEVYAVDGFLTMTFGQNFDSFRDKTLLKMTPSMQVTQFNYQQGANGLTFQNVAGNWMLNGETLLDSTKVDQFTNALRNISGTGFADDFDEVQGADKLYQTLTVSGDNIPSPFVINCYRDTTREKPFVFNSNYNKDVFFESDSAGLVQQLFKPIEFFLPE